MSFYNDWSRVFRNDNVNSICWCCSRFILICCNDFKCNYNNLFYSQCINYNPKHGYVVIIYSGKTDSNANSIFANYIASSVRLSGMNVAGPFDISLANEN